MTVVRVVCAVIVDRGRVLAARRAPGEHLAGFWEFPGGKIEAEETDEAALIREISEELDLTIEPVAPLGISETAQSTRLIRLSAWVCRLVGGKACLRVHDDLKWASPLELELLTWAQADLPFVRQIRGTFELWQTGSSTESFVDRSITEDDN